MKAVKKPDTRLKNLKGSMKNIRRFFSYENSPIKLVIPRSLLRGHLIEGRVRETAGFSVEQSTFIPRQLAAGY